MVCPLWISVLSDRETSTIGGADSTTSRALQGSGIEEIYAEYCKEERDVQNTSLPRL